MPRIYCFGLIAGTAVFSLLLGCAQQPAANTDSGLQAKGGTSGTATDKASDQKKPGNGKDDVSTGGPKQKDDDPAKQQEGQLKWQPVDFTPPDPNQEKYDAAVFEALNLVADKKYPEALLSLEAAAKFRDTEFVQNEIKKLRDRIEQLAAAEQTAHDIQTVLDQGKYVEAAKLATIALQQFGSTDAAPKLIKVKQQADAIVAGGLDDNAAKFKLFSEEGQKALDAGNLRAAAIAFEQALQYGEDAKLKAQFDALRDQLAKYDDNRQKAQDLRKDPARLEEALDLLKAAAKAWDTLQIRQDIDEYTLALQQRRDRLTVADFQVHGDVGIPDAGQVLGEALLPYFKSRFDLVERLQINKLIDELKLEAGKFGDNLQDQQAVTKLAKVRFLVLGSITRISGLSASARLVDAQTGLVIQTAKISAATPDELLHLLPELAKMLQMSDDQRAAYEEELAKAAKVIQPVEVGQPLPPPPDPIKKDDPTPVPPVEIVDTPIPPDPGGLKPDDFNQIKLPPVGQPLPPLVPGGEQEEIVKRKALVVALQLGDNAFFNGNYPLAMQYFQFAFTLDPDNIDIKVRIDRTVPYLQPPPVIVVLPPPPPPRIAIVNFVVAGSPKKVPPWLAWWTPQNLMPYLATSYEIVPPGPTHWWMKKMGITTKQLMFDPYARMWLGRAMNVQYFLFGNIVETASFDVNTFLVEAETGYLKGRGWMHAHHPDELRFRLGDLAAMTLGDPTLWQQQQQQYGKYEQLVIKAQLHTNKGDFTIAIDLFKQAQGLRPGCIEVDVYLRKAEQMSKHHGWEKDRQREFEEQQKRALEWKLRQDALAQQAEQQRILAAQAAAALSEAQRQQFEAKCLAEKAAAHQRLVLQARLARQKNNFKLSIQTYESALSLKQSDDVYRELAEVKAKLNQLTLQQQADEAKLQAAQLEIQRQKELAPLGVKLAAERKQREAAEAAARKAQQDKDKDRAQILVDQGKQEFANAKYNAAISSFQAAQRFSKDKATAELLSMALIAQAKANADVKGEEARKQLERQLALEKAQRLKAEAEAKINQEKYQLALQMADKALANREYDAAASKYNEAGKYFKTDAVLTGLKKAQTARDEAKAAAIAIKQKQLDQETRLANFQKLMGEGQTALAGKDYASAAAKFGLAHKLMPDNVDAIAALSKAEQLRDHSAGATTKKAQEDERLKTFNHLLEDGKTNLAKKQYDVAIANLTEALKLNPGHVEATKALEAARSAIGAGQLDDAKKKTEAYQKAMSDGRLAMQNKQYDSAIKAFEAAQKLLPGDMAALAFLKNAQKGKDDAQAAAKQKAADLQRAQDVQKAINDGRTALAGKNLKAANDALSVAAKLAPNDPKVLQFRNDLQKAEALATAQADAEAKRKVQFDNLIAAGQKALKDQRYDDAVKLLSNATALIPGDKAGQDLLKLAHQQQKIATDLAAKLAAEKTKLAKVQQLVMSAELSIKSKQLDAAGKALQEAAALAPMDANVIRVQKLLAQARADAAIDADKAKKKASYDQAIKAGQDLLAMKKYAEAIKAFQLAGTYMPGDATAAALVKQAQKASMDAILAQQDAQKKAEFNRLMKEGQAALAAKKYADAVKFYADATKLIPTDATAAAALKEANREWEVSKLPPTPTPAQKAEYDRQMKAGAAFDKQKKWDDAIKAYEAALKQIPKDAKATYSWHMSTGNHYMGLKQYANAVREFQAALQLYPNDAEATMALKKAKEAK
jgi:tetratricopeptide (TPR) repeat protein